MAKEDAPKKEKEKEDTSMTTFDVIEGFELDYFLGNAVRFILEHNEGDPLENLQAAKMYLEEKITRLEYKK